MWINRGMGMGLFPLGKSRIVHKFMLSPHCFPLSLQVSIVFNRSGFSEPASCSIQKECKLFLFTNYHMTI